MRNAISLFAAFVGLVVIVALASPSAQAQPQSQHPQMITGEASPTKIITTQTTNLELAKRFGDPAKDLERFVYSFQRVAWDEICWDKTAKQWRGTTECTTGDGKLANKAQVAFVICRMAEDSFARGVFRNPLNNKTSEDVSVVQEMVKMCEDTAREALAMMK